MKIGKGRQGVVSATFGVGIGIGIGIGIDGGTDCDSDPDSDPDQTSPVTSTEGLQNGGIDETRTRDLRRDRPAL